MDNNNRKKLIKQVAARYSQPVDKLSLFTTFTDVISAQDISGHISIVPILQKTLETIAHEIKTEDQPQWAKELLPPSQLITFFFPVDFYIPLEAEHVPVAISPDYINKTLNIRAVTPVVDMVKFKDARYRFSWLMVTIGNNVVDGIKDIQSYNRNTMLGLYLEAVQASNCLIGAYQCLPFRHNHNLSPVTKQSLPEKINVALSQFGNDAKISYGQFITMRKTEGEKIFTLPLLNEETELLKKVYADKVFSDKKVFQLISKFQQSLNSRCFNHDEDAIVYANDFAELSANYLLYEFEILKGKEKEDAVQLCHNLSKGNMESFWKELARILNVSGMGELKSLIEFDEWNTYCRKVRNHITHRFLMQGATEEDSGHAVFCSGQMVKVLCDLALEVCTDDSLRGDISLLRNTTLMAEVLFHRKYKCLR